MPPAALMLRTASSTAICPDSPTVAPLPVSGIIAPTLIGGRAVCALAAMAASATNAPASTCLIDRSLFIVTLPCHDGAAQAAKDTLPVDDTQELEWTTTMRRGASTARSPASRSRFL